MQRAMERHHAGKARVIPILLRSCDWQNTSFGKLRALPSRPVMDWANHENAFTDIAQSIKAALQDVEHLTVDTSTTAFPRVWNIPYPRNPFFTGQEKVLTQLADALKAGQATALSQPQAIIGLGGIGKTQIALEFAYQHALEYDVVLWVLADTRESLVSGYIAMAQ